MSEIVHKESFEQSNELDQIEDLSQILAQHSLESRQREEFKETLIKQHQTEVMQTFTIHEEWIPLFNELKPEIQLAVGNVLQQQRQISGTGRSIIPESKDWFAAFNATPLSKVRVVIIGQDPYPQAEIEKIPVTEADGSIRFNVVKQFVAHGLSFSTINNKKKKDSNEELLPASLRNIFYEISQNCPEAKCTSGNLTNWTRQGVFLLNSCLTVNEGEPGSHRDIWLPFIKRVLEHVITVNPNVIFCVWGKKAESIIDKLNKKPRNVLKAGHPSPTNRQGGFKGCGHFRQVNEILASLNQPVIDWSTYA